MLTSKIRRCNLCFINIKIRMRDLYIDRILKLHIIELIKTERAINFITFYFPFELNFIANDQNLRIVNNGTGVILY